MSKEVSNTIYSAKDIEQYLLGKMSNEEMYAIEKAALDDPLLAEAMEGFEGMEEKNWDKVIAELKGKLTEVENIAVVNFDKYSFARRWRIAAALLLLVSGLAIAYLFTPHKSPASFADVKKLDKTVTNDAGNGNSQTDSVILPGNKPATHTKDQSSIIPIEPIIQPKPLNSASIYKPSKDVAKNDFVYTPNQQLLTAKEVMPIREEEYRSNAAATDAVAAGSANAIGNDGGLDANATVEKKKSSTAQFQNRNLSNTQTEASLKNNNYLNGQVVGYNNNPLPYAQINTAEGKAPVFADAKGNFKIASADTSMAVVVNAAGYSAKNITLQNVQSQQKIVLDQAAVELKEFNSSKSKAATKEFVMKKAQQKELEEQVDEDAEPVNGWANYNNYLLENIIQNSTILDKQVHGIVEVFIKLNNEGNITKVKVTKSLCPECDAAAVRLVKEGPKWKVKNKTDNKVRVKVEF